MARLRTRPRPSMDVEGFTHSEGLLGGELHAAQAPLIMRFDKARKQLGGLLSPFHHNTIGQVELIVFRILGHDPIPVTLVERVKMLVDHRLWRRLPLEWR